MTILTSGDDRYTGSSGVDVVFSGNGNDRTVTGAGNDVSFTGAGADYIEAMAGNDIGAGGAGNDIIGGQSEIDLLWGGTGNDTIAGGVDDDILNGGTGADTFQYGHTFGNDVVTDFEFGVDKMNFFVGSITGANKNVTIRTLAELNAAVDTYDLEVTRFGTDGIKVDLLNGSSVTLIGAADEYFGDPIVGGNVTGTSIGDTLYGTQGDNFIVSGTGNDLIYAGTGNDQVEGNAGGDIISGEAGDDALGAQSGDDIIFGGAGSDTISGGVDNDTLTGDDGTDTFQFGLGTGVGYGNDIVTDFEDGDKVNFYMGTIDLAKNVSATSIADLKTLADDYALAVSFDDDSVTIGTNGGDSVTFIGIRDAWDAIIV